MSEESCPPRPSEVSLKIELLIICEVISDLHVAQQREGQQMLGLLLCSAGKCVFVFAAISTSLMSVKF